MKGTHTRQMLERLRAELIAGLPARVATARAEFPAETLSDIAEVYLEEEDYDLVVQTPCLLVFFGDPEPNNVSSEFYDFRCPVDVYVYDTPGQDGMTALQKRLWTYQGCAVDLILSDLRSAGDLWYDVQLVRSAGLNGLVDERFSQYGRYRGYRFNFFVSLSY